MRRGLTSYDDDDFALFLRNTKAMGYSDDALERPLAGAGSRGGGSGRRHVALVSGDDRGPIALGLPEP